MSEEQLNGSTRKIDIIRNKIFSFKENIKKHVSYDVWSISSVVIHNAWIPVLVILVLNGYAPLSIKNPLDWLNVIAVTAVSFTGYYKLTKHHITESKNSERVNASCQGITEKLIQFYKLRTALREGREPEILVNGRIDLNGLDAIPLILHDDQVFRENICPINKTPIRDPVRDPDGNTVYERAAIYNLLNLRQESPVTGLPLTKEQLQDMPDMRAVIDGRLHVLQDGIIAQLQREGRLL
ncbi:MAG: hypothetical protein A2888_00820 [Chlamydiae bacterium RIFCSPLOWO2_01_FULL_28_7]|nr:MAG: hypothetical protein A2888_00820 [Chlamydiae bacterium RIFCSPLOWO2_01_FULL_28_7]